MPQLPDRPDLAQLRGQADGAAQSSDAGQPDAGELIEGQYADRPQLRPILDAVLALLPALGPATVQARKTIVSLVSPRRTFAVVRATTKDRVDLGLRAVELAFMDPFTRQRVVIRAPIERFCKEYRFDVPRL